MVIAYIDECGRGPLWGPVYAAAVIWDETKEIVPPFPVKSWDSKKLSEKKRKLLYEYIKSNTLDYSIGICSAQEIDSLGIYVATMKAFHNALDNLTIPFDMIYVDGPRFEVYCTKEDFVCHKCFIKGDDLHPSIGMASIIAKVSRDEYMYECCRNNPDLSKKYSLDKNKGYGTKAHIDGLKKYGPTCDHRRSFKWGNGSI